MKKNANGLLLDRILEPVSSSLNKEAAEKLLTLKADRKTQARVSKLADELQPSLGAANLGDGLQQANRLWTASDPAADKVLYVISDFQRNACHTLAQFPLPRER